MTTKRRRLPADEARELILEVTQEHLTRRGPSAIRLQEIAADVGMSHQALLHHFGSREQLVREAAAESTKRIEADLLAMLAAAVVEPKNVAKRGAEGLSELLIDKGHARTIAWLVLGDEVGAPFDVHAERLTNVAQSIQALRVAAGTPGAYRETLFNLTLGLLAVACHALLYEPLQRAGIDREEFISWLADLMEVRLAGPQPE